MIEYLAQVINYYRRRKDPAVWFSVGFSLYFASDVLWKRLHPALDAWQGGEPLTDDQERALRLKGPFAMLAGMAIETMLKGVIVQRLGSPHTTHGLEALSKAAKISWNQTQLELLRRLTTFIRWAGRYPIGLSEEESNESRSLKSTDYVTIASIAGHLFDLHHGKVANGTR